MGTQSPLKKRHSLPQFSARLLWPSGWIHQDATWYGGRHRPARPHCDRWGPSSPERDTTPPPFRPMHCGLAAERIKMPHGTEVGLSPGDFVLDGDPALQKAAQPPLIFGSCLFWPNDWMDQDVTWYGGRPWPRPHCVRWGPSSQKGAQQPPNFRPMSVVAKRLDESRCHLVRR